MEFKRKNYFIGLLAIVAVYCVICACTSSEPAPQHFSFPGMSMSHFHQSMGAFYHMGNEQLTKASAQIDSATKESAEVGSLLTEAKGGLGVLNQVKSMDKAAIAKLASGSGGSFLSKYFGWLGFSLDETQNLAEWGFIDNISTQVNEADTLQKQGHTAITEGKKVMDMVMKGASYFSLAEMNTQESIKTYLDKWARDVTLWGADKDLALVEGIRELNSYIKSESLVENLNKVYGQLQENQLENNGLATLLAQMRNYRRQNKDQESLSLLHGFDVAAKTLARELA